MLTLPKLFKKSSTGALLEWEIGVEDADIITRHGQVGGAIQEARETIKVGKNVGRANETTPVQQAALEARAEWIKKIQRHGYVEDQARAAAGERDQAGGIPPMLAKAYEDCAKKFKFPCHVQRKLDGVRCIAVIQDGEVTLWSRKCEAIEVPVPHIIEALAKQFAGMPGRHVLDGELYRHGWSLQKIASFVRQKKKPKDGYFEIGYHIYDAPRDDATFEERNRYLGIVLRGCQHPLLPVHTWVVDSYDTAKAQHDKIVTEEGYEGLMLRGSDSLYESGKRSANLLKLKFFQDAEFKIVGVKEGRGKFEGLAIFTCATKEDKLFDCCAPGSLDDRREWLRKGPEVIGKPMTVKFFDWTEDQLPRFPVGKAIRDYE